MNPSVPPEINGSRQTQLLRKHVFPFLGDGVPLAMAVATPSLRLTAEMFRADDNYTHPSPIEPLAPRALGEPDGPGLYTAKAARHCGVRVGTLISTLHVVKTASRPRDSRRWRSARARTPAVATATATELTALRAAWISEHWKAVMPSRGELYGLTAAVLPPCTAGEHDDFSSGLRLSHPEMTAGIYCTLADTIGPLTRAKYEHRLANFCRIMDAKQHILHSKTEEDDTTATPLHQHQQQEQRRSPVRRHVYLQDDGSAEQLLSLSRWWLERPIHSSSTFCPMEGSPMPDVQSPPLYLHLFSPSMADVRAAVKAICGPQQRLEGLYVSRMHADTPIDDSNMQPFHLPASVLTHLRVLALPNDASDDMLRAVLTPAPGEDGRSPSVRCRLEVVQLAGGRRVQSLEPLLALAPIAAPDSGTAVLFRGLTSVDVSFTAIDNAALDGLLARSPHLHRLSVAGCVRVSALGRPGRHLWHLDASHTGVDGAGIAGLAGHPALAHLSLSNCARLTDVTALSELPALLALDITGVAATRGVDRLHACRALEQLSVGRGNDIGLFPATTPTAVSSFAALTRLVLSSVPWLDDAAVERLARTDAPLAVLTLSGAPEQLTTLNPLAGDLDHPGFRHTLKTLILRQNPGLTVAGISNFIEFDALEEVEVMNCVGLIDLSALAQVPSVRVLATEYHRDRAGNELLAGYTRPIRASTGGGGGGVVRPLGRQLDVLLIPDHENISDAALLGGMPNAAVADFAWTAVSSEALALGVATHLAAAAAEATPAAALPATPVTLSSPLTTVRLDHCGNVTDVSCLADLPSLRVVSLIATSVTDEGIARLLFRAGPGVEVLDLTSCRQISLDFGSATAPGEGPEGAVTTGAGEGGRSTAGGEIGFSSLTHLSLEGCEKVTDGALARLFQQQQEPSRDGLCATPTFFRHLTELSVALVPGVTSIEPLLPLAASLTVLSLRQVSLRPDGLSKLHRLRCLRSLDAFAAGAVSGMVRVLAHPTLRKLDIRELDMAGEDGSHAGDDDDDAEVVGPALEELAITPDRGHLDLVAALILPDKAETDEGAAMHFRALRLLCYSGAGARSKAVQAIIANIQAARPWLTITQD